MKAVDHYSTGTDTAVPVPRYRSDPASGARVHGAFRSNLYPDNTKTGVVFQILGATPRGSLGHHHPPNNTELLVARAEI